MEVLSSEYLANDKEIEQKMEDEHLRLQRQVRMIQNDRDQASMGVHPQFRRQDRLMRILKKDYINLVKDLKVAKSGAHKKNDVKMKAGLKRALLHRVQTGQECEEGLFVMDQLEEVFQRKKKQMIDLRKSVTATIGQLQERRNLSESRLMSTENKLEAAMNRFNVIQSDNKRIRDEIEHMLKDRALFNQAWTKMLNCLGRGKKFLDDLFESSTLAYDQRDEWCTKLRSVQEKGKMDQMLQVEEMRDLQRAFDHKMKLHYFLAKKGIIRINEKEEEREEEMRLKEEENITRDIEKHTKILHEIKDYTKEEDVNKIIDVFDLIEQNNFSLYKLLTDFCAENEVLTRDLKCKRRDIDDRREWNEMIEEKRQAKLNKIKDQLEKQKIRTEEKRMQEAEATAKLKVTMEKTEEIFKMLNCSIEPFQNLLGDKGPSINHMGLTFRLITEKIKEYVELVYYDERLKQSKGDKKSSRLKKYVIHSNFPKCTSLPSINGLVPANPCPACVEARWMLRVSEKPEEPFDRAMVLTALAQLSEDPAFVRSDRIHPLTECRAPRSREILARRYM